MGRVSDILRLGVDGLLGRGSNAYERLNPGPPRLGGALPAPPAPTSPPVVLVPGFSNDAGFLDVWRRSLAADGFNVYVFDDPDKGLGSVRTAAQRLGSYVGEVQAKTGAQHVDVVGYSSGNTVGRTWMQLDDGAPKVGTFVSLDGAWRGDDDSTFLNRLKSVPVVGKTLHDGLPESYLDLQHDSPLFRELGAKGELPTGVRVAAVYPARSEAPDHIPGAINLPLADNPGHFAVARSSNSAYEAARGVLLNSVPKG